MGNFSNKANIEADCTSIKLNHIVLMGDSVLDNFYWLNKEKEDVCFQLNKALSNTSKYHKQSKCTNLALDETESKDIFNGKTPSSVYVKRRNEIGMNPYQISEDGIYWPLDQLEKLNNEEIKPTHVVLSIGGNDARVSLLSNSGDIKKVLIDLQDSFIDNYSKAIDSVLLFNKQIIIVIVYRPGPGFLLELDQTSVLFSKLVPNMLTESRVRKLPVIDLSRTFNPLDKSHYGSTPIEPSNKSGLFIVDLIETVLRDFNYEKDESKIYYGIGKDIKIDLNEDNYKYKL